MNTINEKYEAIHFGPIVVKTNIGKEKLKEVRKIISKKGKPHNKNLAGIIKHEYLIDIQKFVKLVAPSYEPFVNAVKGWTGQNLKRKLNFNDAWVNYMVAGEFNPPHVHNNCNISSVLFVQVPDGIKKENEEVKKRGITSSGPGTLVFLYGELGFFNIVERTYLPEEGDLFVFPASLKHYVSPFTCKGERISVAANAFLE